MALEDLSSPGDPSAPDVGIIFHFDKKKNKNQMTGTKQSKKCKGHNGSNDIERLTQRKKSFIYGLQLKLRNLWPLTTEIANGGNFTTLT